MSRSNDGDKPLRGSRSRSPRRQISRVAAAAAVEAIIRSGCFSPADPDEGWFDALERANIFLSLAQKLVTEARESRRAAASAEATALDLVVEARRLIEIVAETRGGNGDGTP